MKIALYGIFALLVLCSCAPQHDPYLEKVDEWEKPSIVTFAWLNQNIFRKTCTGCHGSNSHQTKGGGYDLSSYEAYLFDIENIWSQIERNRMPKNRPPLTAREKAAIREWIDSGLPQRR